MAFLVIFGMHVSRCTVRHGDHKNSDNCVGLLHTIFGERSMRLVVNSGAPTAQPHQGEVYKRYGMSIHRPY